jgi:hypothetical protein
MAPLDEHRVALGRVCLVCSGCGVCSSLLLRIIPACASRRQVMMRLSVSLSGSCPGVRKHGASLQSVCSLSALLVEGVLTALWWPNRVTVACSPHTCTSYHQGRTIVARTLRLLMALSKMRVGAKKLSCRWSVSSSVRVTAACSPPACAPCQQRRAIVARTLRLLMA